MPGIRLAMTYNLCYTGTAKDMPIIQPPVSKCPEKISEEVSLQEISKIWAKSYNHNRYPFLAHCLEHEYTPQSFKNDKKDSSLFDFKGSDKFINQLIDSKEFHIYIHKFTKIDKGYGDNEGFGDRDVNIGKDYIYGKWRKDIQESEIEIKDLFYQNNTDSTNSTSSNTTTNKFPLPDQVKKIFKWNDSCKILERTYIYNSDYYFDCPDYEEYEGYQGNYAGSYDEWYNKTLLIFFPKKCYIDLIANDISISSQRLAEAIADVYENQPGGVPYSGYEEDKFLHYLRVLDNRCYEEDIVDNILPERLTDLFFMKSKLNPKKMSVGVSMPSYREMLEMNRAMSMKLLIDIAEDHFCVMPYCYLQFFNNKHRLSFNFWKEWITFSEHADEEVPKSGIETFFKKHHIVGNVNEIAVECILNFHKNECRDQRWVYHERCPDRRNWFLREHDYYYNDIEEDHTCRKIVEGLSDTDEEEEEDKQTLEERLTHLIEYKIRKKQENLKLNDAYFTNQENLNLILKFLSSFHQSDKSKTETDPEKSDIPKFLENQPKNLINFSIIKNLLLLEDRLSNQQMRNCLKSMSGHFCEILRGHVF